MENQKIEVDGQEFDAETVSEAIRDTIIGRAPVAVMDELELRDGITNRLRWSLGSVTLIACHRAQDNCVIDTADAAVLHIEQALAMVRELNDRRQEADE
jgi:hypothetical protein